MANEWNHNILDSSFVTTFALPTTFGTLYQSFDLGTTRTHLPDVELRMQVGALSDTIAPSGASAGWTYRIDSSTSSTFATVARTLLYLNSVGTGSGVAAFDKRIRLPADCERYIRAAVTMPTTATTAAAVTATFSMLF